MDLPPSLWGAVLFAGAALLFIWWMVRRLGSRNTVVEDDPVLWPDRAYPCPKCATPMDPGYVMLGRGVIWTPRDGKPISALAHIGQTLPNTLSFDLPPASNGAWRCEPCGFLLVDHSRMIRRRRHARRTEKRAP